MNPEKPDTGMDQDPPGSPETGEPAFIEAGLIRRPHGIKGEILVDIYEDLNSSFSPGQVIYIGEEHLAWSLKRIREHKKGYLLSFDEINTPELASNYRFKKLYISSLGFVPKKPKRDQVLDDQILGLLVITDNDEELGFIKEIIKTGANDVYVIDSSNGDILIPAIPDVVLRIDIVNNQMLVHIIPGLIAE